MSQFALRRTGSTRVLPGFGLSMGISVLFISLVLLLPITGLFGQLAGLSLAEYWAIITEGRVGGKLCSHYWCSSGGGIGECRLRATAGMGISTL
jgi:ABC-type sulfate transport system permease component